MKLRKTLILLSTIVGAGALASTSVLAEGYTQSFSGNVRVEALSTSETVGDDSTDTLTTNFGGDEEESTTGGDTYLQWNHKLEGEDGVGNGFIRFAADGQVRIGVDGTYEKGNYKGEIKAEWERNGFGGITCTDAARPQKKDADGNSVADTECSTSVGERDQFAKLSHTGIGLYYKIGREEWFGNQKGYASDFGSATKGFADAGALGTRVSGHALGWAGAGLDVSLFLQRDNGGSSSGRPIGLGSGSLTGYSTGGGLSVGYDASSEVSSAGIRLGYANSIVDVAFATVSGSVASSGEQAYTAVVETLTTADGSTTRTYEHVESNFDKAHKDTSMLNELQLKLTFGSVSPFINFGSLSAQNQISLQRAVAGSEVRAVTVKDVSASGWNLGVDIGLGASDLVLAFGVSSSEDAEAGRNYRSEITGAPEDDPATEENEGAPGQGDNRAENKPVSKVERSGFDLIWATNQAPLKVSLYLSSVSGSDTRVTGVTFNNEGNVASTTTEADDYSNLGYGVRLDFGF